MKDARVFSAAAAARIRVPLDATCARPADLLSERFFDEVSYKPGMFEVNAWRNSLLTVSSELAEIRDQEVPVELMLRLASERLNVLPASLKASHGSGYWDGG